MSLVLFGLCVCEIIFRESTYDYKILGEPVYLSENEIRVRFWETRMTILGKYENVSDYIGVPNKHGEWRSFDTAKLAHLETRRNLTKAFYEYSFLHNSDEQ